jgi:hypothetical protein
MSLNKWQVRALAIAIGAIYMLTFFVLYWMT